MLMSSSDFEPSGDPGHAPSPALLVEGGTFEHPLTAATTAMLNINGASEDGGPGFNVFYDIYGKTLSTSDPSMLKAERNVTSADIWSPVGVTSSGGKMGNGDMSDTVFVTSASSPLNHKLTSVLRTNSAKLKLNGHHHHSTDGGVIVVKEELHHPPHSPSSPSARLNGILGVVSTDADGYPAFATLNPTHYDYAGGGVITTAATVVSSPQQFTLRSAGGGIVGGYATEPYYRDYFPPDYAPANATRVISGYDGPTSAETYRATVIGGPYKNPVTIDVNSPDSGIGAESITPRDHSTAPPGFDYNEMVNQSLMGEISGGSSNAGSATGRSTPASTPTLGQQPKATRPWHEFGRTSETDKIQIPKLFLNCGFRYHLESPISTSQRREDDRITYINKGQFYGITLDFIPDPEKPLKSQTVKSVVMLVFREEKSPEDEIKAWQFWHSRQHSVKQRILDADTKNSVGLVGCIDEVAHNAIAVYWNPLESSGKINVAVQCLSTDFSSQKGVKGLPLHLQVDTYDDPRDPNCPIYHRGYAQIKVFCDKGAERKTRDEERRAAKRKLTATGRKKLDELYHTPIDRTEFYAMSDLSKPPVLFSPAEDLDKVNLTPLAEFHGYYGGTSEGSDTSAAVGEVGHRHKRHHHHRVGSSPPPSTDSSNHGSPSPRPQQHRSSPHHPTLKFHNTFPPDSPPPTSTSTSSIIIRYGGPVLTSSTSSSPPKEKGLKDALLVDNGNNSTNNNSTSCPSPSASHHHNPHHHDHHNGNNSSHQQQQQQQQHNADDFLPSPLKRFRPLPQPSERLMIYIRQEGEDVFTPIHLAPPTTLGLLASLEEKFKISMGSVKNLFRRSGKGVLAKVDDEMLKHYCHEDMFLLEVKASENEDAFDLTLVQLCVDLSSPGGSLGMGLDPNDGGGGP